MLAPLCVLQRELLRAVLKVECDPNVRTFAGERPAERRGHRVGDNDLIVLVLSHDAERGSYERLSTGKVLRVLLVQRPVDLAVERPGDTSMTRAQHTAEGRGARDGEQALRDVEDQAPLPAIEEVVPFRVVEVSDHDRGVL